MPGQPLWWEPLLPDMSEGPQQRCLGMQMNRTLANSLDVLSRVVGAAGFLYAAACAAVQTRGGDEDPLDGVAEFVKASCPGGYWWLVIGLPAGILLFRPLWIIVSQKLYTRGTLYSFCVHRDKVKPWRCCCGCSWIFPFLCLFSIVLLTVGHFTVNSLTYGVTGSPTGPERSEDPPIELTFWGSIEQVSAVCWLCC